MAATNDSAERLGWPLHLSFTRSLRQCMATLPAAAKFNRLIGHLAKIAVILLHEWTLGSFTYSG